MDRDTKAYIIIASVLILMGVLSYWFKNSTPQNNYQQESSRMQITSPAFAEGGNIPAKYTCQGEGINPELDFSGVPSAAKSLALIMDDPDAPSGIFVHWVMWGMPPTQTKIYEGEMRIPESPVREGLNGSGKNGYIGPCPPSETHHYHFKLYALDFSDLGLDASTTDKTALEAAMQGHIIAQAELVGLYSK